MRSLCTDCSKRPLGAKTCGLYGILAEMVSRGYSVAISKVDGKDAITVICSEYKGDGNEKHTAGGCLRKQDSDIHA